MTSEREEVLNEVASLLNRGENAGALKALRRLHRLHNMWECQDCHHRSSSVREGRCPLCSGEVKVVVVRDCACAETKPQPKELPSVEEIELRMLKARNNDELFSRTAARVAHEMMEGMR